MLISKQKIQGSRARDVAADGPDASNYTQFLPVTRLYLKAGEVDETIRILSTIIERMLAGREERNCWRSSTRFWIEIRITLLRLRMLVRIHWWQRDMDALRLSLERLAESAEASELVDEERYALTQLVRLAPDEQRYLDRLNLLGGLQEESAEDFSTARAESDVPQFETFAVVEDEDQAEPFAPLATDEFETNAAPGSTFSDPTASFADLNEDESAVCNRSYRLQEVDFSIVSTPDTPVVVDEAAPADEGGKRT